MFKARLLRLFLRVAPNGNISLSCPADSFNITDFVFDLWFGVACVQSKLPILYCFFVYRLDTLKAIAFLSCPLDVSVFVFCFETFKSHEQIRLSSTASSREIYIIVNLCCIVRCIADCKCAVMDNYDITLHYVI